MKNKNNKNYKVTELIMVNPFDNWAYSFVGTVVKIHDGNNDSYYFGMVEIELEKICCISKDKELVARNLEFIFSLKYHHTDFRKKYRTHQTSFTEFILN